jgi:hypothetical protein
MVYSSGFRDYDLGFRVQGFRVQGYRSEASGSGFTVHDSRLRV